MNGQRPTQCETGSTYATIDYNKTIFTVPVGSIYTDAYGINTAGVIAGAFYDNSATGATWHGFTLQNGVFSDPIDFPGASATFVTAINDNGDLAGFYDDSTGEHGFEALVPEPASLSLLALSALMAFPRRRRKA